MALIRRALLLIFVALPSAAGAITGTEWLNLSEEAQHAYIAGITDAWNRLFLLGELAQKKSASYHSSDVEAVYRQIGQCISDQKLSYAAVTDIAKTYTRSHPEEHPVDMVAVLYGALSTRCPVAGGPR